MGPDASVPQNALDNTFGIITHLANRSNNLGSAMTDGHTFGIECGDGEVDCHNDSFLPPPNACVCELAATQFKPEYATFNLILIVIILPVVALFGVVTNALAFYVYSRSHMLTTLTNYYLAALAVSDIFVDLCGISSITIDSARQFDPILNEIHLAIIPYTLPLCYIAQMCSVYFTVLAALDCYFTICWRRPTAKVIVESGHPTRADCISRGTTANLHIASVVIISFLYNCITFGDLHVVECVDYSDPDAPNVMKKEICPTELRLDPTYSQIYKVYMYALFMTFLPFAILLTLNCLILWKMYRLSAQKKLPKLTVTGCDQITLDFDGSEEKDGDSTGESTIMLVMVVALFLTCNSIALVVNIIETFGEYPMEDTEAANRLFFVIDIGNFLVVFNSSANFLIYYAFSKAFRAVLTKKRQQLLSRRTSSSGSLNSQYYLASSSLNLNDDIQETPGSPHNNQNRAPSSVGTTAQAIAAIAVTISLTSPTPSTPAFFDVKNGRKATKTTTNRKCPRGTYELLTVNRVSPASIKEWERRRPGEKEIANDSATSPMLNNSR